MSDNPYLGSPGQYNQELISLLYDKADKSKDKQLLEAIQEMTYTNLETASYSVQALVSY